LPNAVSQKGVSHTLVGSNNNEVKVNAVPLYAKQTQGKGKNRAPSTHDADDTW